MTSAKSAITVDASATVREDLVRRIIGLLTAMVLPALFWVIVAAGIAHTAGVTVAVSALTAFGTAIAVFLGAVCAPIVLKA